MSLEYFLLRIKLFSLKTTSQAKEAISLDDFIQNYPSKKDVIKDPFPHIVVDNFLQAKAYENLCKLFNDIKNRGLSKNPKEYDKFHPFEINYDGYVFNAVPTLSKEEPLSIFFSLGWNILLSKIFQQPTTFETIVAMHHHPKGNRTGFVHHDFVNKFFNLRKRLPNNVVYGGRDTPEGEYSLPRKRIIAILFYLENDGWQKGDGGGTGLYSADTKTLLKTVDPINNRLLVFHISPKSMHAFQENIKERNCMVQWFHTPDDLISLK